MAQNGTLFSPDAMSNSVAGSVDFVKDSFEDTALPASNNTGLTSTVATNPFGVFVANAEAVQYGVKTLWIKGTKLIEDRSKWVNGLPTYEILFHETFPGLFCYAAVQETYLITGSTGDNFEAYRTSDDSIKPFALPGTSGVQWYFGVTGRFSRIAWLVDRFGLNAAVQVDGGAPTNLTYMNLTRQTQTQPYCVFYSPRVHSLTNETDNLHDIRLVPTSTQLQVSSIYGIQVYFENSGANVQVGPGTSYRDKTKLEAASGATYALPAFGNSLGGIATYYKEESGAYATFISSQATVSSIGQGTVGTNLLSVQVGHGASFPSGSGIAVDQGGGSYYVGSVVSVSTDVLTVSPTLYIGVSNTVYRTWQSSPSLVIGSSLYQKVFSWEPEMSIGATYPGAAGIFSFSDPIHNVGVYPKNVTFTLNIGVPLMSFVGITSGNIRAAGDFSAAEIEFMGVGNSAALAVYVNDCFGYSTTAVQPGSNPNDNANLSNTVSRLPIFQGAGPGVNSFELDIAGSAAFNAGVRRINFYKLRPQGATLGVLGSLERNQAFTPRDAVNGARHALGLHRRVPADQIGYTGTSWAQVLGASTFANLRWQVTANNNSFQYYWYGKDIAITGLQGTSANLTIDGVSVAPVFNTMIPVSSEGWHRLEYIHHAGTAYVECLDIARTFNEVQQYQNYKAVSKRKIRVPIFKDYGMIQPLIFGDTANPTKGTTSADYAHVRREGRYLIMEYHYEQTAAGSAGTGNYYLVMPFGLKADNKRFYGGSSQITTGCGSYYIQTPLENQSGQPSVFNDKIYFYGLNGAGGGIGGVWSSGGNALGNTTVVVTANMKIPILGWNDYEEIEVNDG